MIIDSDEEEEPSAMETLEDDDVDYELGEEEFDATAPYEPVVAQLEIAMDSRVLHLAVPSFPTQAPGSPPTHIPLSLSKRAYVAVTCADSSTRLILFNLQPTRHEYNTIMRPKHLETFLSRNQRGFQHPCLGVDMAWMSHRPSTSSVDIDGSEQEQFRRSSNGSTQNQSEEDSCELLIASHSPDITGMLFIWRVSLSNDKKKNLWVGRPVQPAQTQYLPRPAATISFNPSSYRATRRNHLLLADSQGVVRIYDPRLTVGSRPAHSTDHSAGVWLGTFCVPFRDTNSVGSTGLRTDILDARWALNGKCIIVLLENGEWGIWDIEGVGPGLEKATSLKGSNLSRRGVVGGGVTRFAIHGFVGDDSNTMYPSDLSSGMNKTGFSVENKLAPMTPKTRKVRQDTLFNGPAQHIQPTGRPRGGISVQPQRRSSEGSINDDSLLVWFDSAVYYIPSLMTYWQRALAGRSGRSTYNAQAGSLYGPNITQLTALSTSGENITSLSQFPSSSDAKMIKSGALQHTILLSAEHRLIMLGSAKNTQKSMAPLKDLPHHGLDGEATQQLDQHHLSKGTLDLGGMDRLLDGMAGGELLFGNIRGANVAPQARKVGFAIDF